MKHSGRSIENYSKSTRSWSLSYIVVAAIAASTILICFEVYFIFRNLIAEDFSNHELIPSSVGGTRREPLLASKVGPCVITIAALNRFGFVWNLYDSVRENSPDLKCFLWYMADAAEPKEEEGKRGLEEVKQLIATKEYFQMVTLEEIDGLDIDRAAFMFDQDRLQARIKPFAFKHAFDALGAQSAIFLECDVWVTDSLREVENHLSQYSAIVTPKMLPSANRKIESLTLGAFNFGFVAFRNTQTSHRFLDFWGEQLILYGFLDSKNHLFFDESYGQFITTFFEKHDHLVLRGPRYNIDYGNHRDGFYLEKGLVRWKDQETAEDCKSLFLHFSDMPSLESYQKDAISHYITSFHMSDEDSLKDVLSAYVERLQTRKALEYQKYPYGYSTFENGGRIFPWMRRLYSEVVFPHPGGKGSRFRLGDEDVYGVTLSPFFRETFQNDERWKNPFQSFPQWLLQTTTSTAVDMDGQYFYTILEEQVWNARPDLQKSFENPTGLAFGQYKNWFTKNAERDTDGIMDSVLMREWEKQYEFNQHHHALFHKRVGKNDDLGINIYGWHCGLFSIGIVARQFVLAAKAANFPVNAIEASMFPDKKYVPSTENDFQLTRKMNLPVNLVVMNGEQTPDPFSRDVPDSLRKSKYTIGYWNWELDRFRPHIMRFLRYYDEIWVASPFVKTSLERTKGYDGTMVRVLPIPYEPNQSKQKTPLPPTLKELLHLEGTKHPFSFLVVFDFQSFEERKNPQASIKAFLEAFPLAEDSQHKYQLIVKSHSGSKEQLDTLSKVANNDPRIVFINHLLTDEENSALHEYQDCHLSLHRSEGYGMNILESMSIGIPVIATNYSGNTIFFEAVPNWKDSCTFPIPYELVELKETYGPYNAGSFWAEADTHAAALAMRTAAEKNCKQNFGEKLAQDTVSRFGLEAVGKQMKANLEDSFLRILAKGNLVS